MDKIKHLFENTKLTIKDISLHSGVSFSRVFKYIEDNYTREQRLERKRFCYSNAKLGDKNPMQHKPKSEVQVSDGKGYLMQAKPSWYTGRQGCKHVFTHHIVICKALGLTEIPKGFCVHHIDENKTNNELTNLALMTTSAHMRLHQLERATTSRKA